MRKSVKSAIVHTLLLTYIIVPEVWCQQFTANGASVYPNTQFQGNVHGNAAGSKGYSNFQTPPSSYVNAPVHGQYWTGHVQPYPQYTQQYGAYNTGYVQNGAYVPQQYYSQPYGQYGQYGQQYGQYGHYPGFDAQYWTGQYYQHPVSAYPAYHQAPVYQHGVAMYPAYSAYPGQYSRGAYPYHKKRQGRGFLGGTGNGLTKTLLGAAVVGVVAGAVARGK